VSNCPSGTKKYKADNGGPTCCCSDYCCWDNCRRETAPEGKCVDVTVNGERSTTWTYDGGKKFWVLVAGPKLSLVPRKPASGCPAGTYTHYSTGLRQHTCCYSEGVCWDKSSNNDHSLKGIGAEWVRNSAKRFWMAQMTNEPGHCLPHQTCKKGDCCALGTSCKTCPSGSKVNKYECSGKGDYRCN